MKNHSTLLFAGNNDSKFEEVFSDLVETVSGLSETTIEKFFTSQAVGSKSKSLASTVRALILNDLQLKGWDTNWSPFDGTDGLNSAIWNFDAARKIKFNAVTVWLTLEVSFDNRLATGTHLVKSSVSNNMKFRTNQGDSEIIHHCIIAASKSLKTMAGIDSSVASSEEFITAAGPYSSLNPTRTTLVELGPLQTIEVVQRRFEGRTKSKIQTLS